MVLQDISVDLSTDLPLYPGDPPVLLHPLPPPDGGEPFITTKLSFGSHTGTHIDAPKHLLPDGMTVDRIPLETLIGNCLVVDLTTHDGPIDESLLRKLPLKGARRLLFRTRNSALWKSSRFAEEFTALLPSAAAILAQSGVLLVGIDYLSIERPETLGEVHRILLEAGVVILEGLNLAGVERGEYELICLPLKIAGGEGAPCRAILRSRQAPPERPLHQTRWPA